ncbi:hypothetical protein NDU88_005066 [Pleurodeles waltl]|uniref:Uncharacterized protein n=1 Tax=Pleurodeles waltl TaxID=8319 RepID=A0AAV7SKR8_PLEWA|nr:hypothetical protein NDU88_005066 [Pleurodeles waltl]
MAHRLTALKSRVHRPPCHHPAAATSAQLVRRKTCPLTAGIRLTSPRGFGGLRYARGKGRVPDGRPTRMPWLFTFIATQFPMSVEHSRSLPHGIKLSSSMQSRPAPSSIVSAASQCLWRPVLPSRCPRVRARCLAALKVHVHRPPCRHPSAATSARLVCRETCPLTTELHRVAPTAAVICSWSSTVAGGRGEHRAGGPAVGRTPQPSHRHCT